MFRELIGASLFVFPLFSASAATSLSIAVSAYPAHGLPAVGPAIVVVVRNDGSTPIHVPDGRFCVETADSPAPCNLRPYAADWGENWFDIRSAPGPFDLAPKESRTFVAEDLGIFSQRPLLNPGQYKLRFRLSLNDTPSNVLQYTVDQPSGENLLVWGAMTGLSDPTTTPYLDSRLTPVFHAHLSSDYSKIHAFYNDLLTPPANASAQLQRLQGYLASSLPDAFEMNVRLSLPGTYQSVAIALAEKRLLDEAEQQLKLGRAIIDQLSASSNPYAAAVASAIGKTGPWTRSEVSRLAAMIVGTAKIQAKPVHPKVDCVLLNANGTFTAWFGYSNENDGIVGIPLGSRNTFAPPPADRGQPTSYQPGRQRRVFSVTAPLGTRLVWSLLGHDAAAASQDGQQTGDRCNETDEDGEHSIH